MNATLREKEQALRRHLGSLPKAAVAFSGGVDSTLLLRVALDEIGDGATAFVADSAFIGRTERAEALALAEEFGAECRIAAFDPLSSPEIRTNPPDRCYECKKSLMTLLWKGAGNADCAVLLDGTNRDDLSDRRPGLRALRELGVVSPLADAGLGKDEVRALSRRLGIRGCDRPALACLATRIPFGEEITESRLRRIDEAETYFRGMGFANVRVRDFNGMAIVELDERDLEPDSVLLENRAGIRDALRRLGFSRIALDLDGYRSGSLNPSGDIDDSHA